MGAGASRPPAAGKRQAKKSNGSTPRRNASTGTLRSLQAAATIEAALDVCTRAVSAETSPLNIARALRHVAVRASTLHANPACASRAVGARVCWLGGSRIDPQPRGSPRPHPRPP